MFHARRSLKRCSTHSYLVLAISIPVSCPLPPSVHSSLALSSSPPLSPPLLFSLLLSSSRSSSRFLPTIVTGLSPFLPYRYLRYTSLRNVSCKWARSGRVAKIPLVPTLTCKRYMGHKMRGEAEMGGREGGREGEGWGGGVRDSGGGGEGQRWREEER
eukprot:746716-Hanusia_phi.AAC.5